MPKASANTPLSGDLAAAYRALVKTSGLKDDPAQREVLSALQALASRLSNPSKPAAGRFKSLFKKQAAAKPPRSLYIWGNVGRGKSMLMDLFFSHVPLEKKRRVHFHAFMQEVHARIHALRQQSQSHQGSGDPVARLAQEIAAETALLCFDELQATDVADATLLFRLFDGLFAHDVVIVSTSNRPPQSIYTGGVQRERFAKFVALLEERMEVISLSIPLDYRHMQMKSLQELYHYPLDGAETFIDAVLDNLCPGAAPRKGALKVQGRLISFMLYDETIGRFTFRDVCETALGPADYLAIARELDTVILTGIPQLPPEKRNEAKRFVTLIDALYEHKVKLVCTAEGPPDTIYQGGDGSFEFKRTVSRLMEMQSAKWVHNE